MPCSTTVGTGRSETRAVLFSLHFMSGHVSLLGAALVHSLSSPCRRVTPEPSFSVHLNSYISLNRYAMTFPEDDMVCLQMVGREDMSGNSPGRVEEKPFQYN